jgi:glutaminyl-peptide cyclotransferase
LKTLSIQSICIAALFVVCTCAGAATPVYTYVIKHTYPHDTEAFTEGLLIKDGFLYESTGLNGKSSISKKDLKTGKTLMKIDVPPEFFGEGIAIFGNELFALTWQNHVGFVYDLKTLKVKRKFAYPYEGWGMTSDDEHIYASDGSSIIHILDPKTMQEVRHLNVTFEGKDITQLNELEWVDGEIYANVWRSNFIVRINPLTGQVAGVLDLTNIITLPMGGVDDVLNGIAYDSRQKHLYVTGKHWPSLFEIELVERKK